MKMKDAGTVCLRVDAAYCAVAAACAAAFVKPLGSALGIPTALLLGVAAVVVGWAGLLLLAASRLKLRARTVLMGVLAVNVVAAALIIGLAAARPGDALSALLMAVAVEVAGFAGWQAAVLRSLGRAAA